MKKDIGLESIACFNQMEMSLHRPLGIIHMTITAGLLQETFKKINTVKEMYLCIRLKNLPNALVSGAL